MHHNRLLLTDYVIFTLAGFYLGFLVWGRRSGLKLMVGVGGLRPQARVSMGVWGHAPPPPPPRKIL